MSRTFLYIRVSSTDLTMENQLAEVAAAGFHVDPQRIVVENVSGSVPAKERPAFNRLLAELDKGDVLIVTKLDRFGRNALDVRQTVAKLSALAVRVHCLALGGMDLSSVTGKMAMLVITAVAEFERDLLIERTHAGLKRVRDEGRTLGRPTVLNPDEQATVRKRLANGESLSAIAREYKTTRQTIMRVRDRGNLQRFAKHPRASGAPQP